MNKPINRLAVLSTIFMFTLTAAKADAQYGHGYAYGPHVQHVMAEIDDTGAVVVRRFSFVFAMPAPKTIPTKEPKPAPPKKVEDPVALQPLPPPKVEAPVMNEFRLRFKAGDLIFLGLDGRPVEPRVWQKALAKPAAVLMSPIPCGDEEGGGPTPSVPANLQDVYRKDTLVLFTKRSPLETTPPADVKADGPKTEGPQIVLVSYLADKNLRFRTKYDNQVFKTMKVLETDKEGKPHVLDITVKMTMQGVNTEEIPARFYKLLDANGKVLPSERMAELLAKERHVLQSHSGAVVDPFYLRLLRSDALILAMPMAKGQVAPALSAE